MSVIVQCDRGDSLNMLRLYLTACKTTSEACPKEVDACEEGRDSGSGEVGGGGVRSKDLTGVKAASGHTG